MGLRNILYKNFVRLCVFLYVLENIVLVILIYVFLIDNYGKFEKVKIKLKWILNYMYCLLNNIFIRKVFILWLNV